MGLGILAVLFGGFMTWVMGFSLAKKLVPALRATRKGAEAQGRIVRVKVVKQRYGTRHQPVVRFATPDGRTVEFLDAIPSQQGFHTPGDLVTVRYDPVDPEDSATLGGGTDALRSVMISVGVLTLFVFVTVFGLLLVIGVVKTQ